MFTLMIRRQTGCGREAVVSVSPARENTTPVRIRGKRSAWHDTPVAGDPST